MLAGMRSKRNTHPLLLEEQTCTATMEISVAVPLEVGNRTTSRFSIYFGKPHSWAYTKRTSHPTRDILAHP